ncbi:MAG TPA: DNA-processing protein DprA [Mycobacteriales bacterium]|jgi:DNA processing protein|nr:DNA-processing protein DprA [Mycobacteriales bacterium]
MTPVSDAERVARATLLRVTEPGTAGVVERVREVGVAQTLADIAAGRPIGDADVAALQHRLRTASGAADLEAATAVGARLVCPDDAEWPRALDDLAWVGRDCFGLWVRGPHLLAEACEQAVAVVGTRAATDYGLAMADRLAGGLAELGWTVVSGLAYGIDTAAHRATLGVGGLTVACVACGIDRVYPPGNRALFERIAAEGLLVSEHPPGAAPYRTRFLVRNRIIAALSQGTLVVEMAVRSGARSTATHAAAINRHVMCVPGPVTSALSAGCHQLLRERPETVLVTRASEVVEQCGPMGALAPRQRGPAVVRDQLGPAVARVLEGVPVRRAASAASIATAAGVSLAVAEAALAALGTAGLVRRTDEGWGMTPAGRDDRRVRRAEVQESLDLW